MCRKYLVLAGVLCIVAVNVGGSEDVRAVKKRQSKI